MKRYADYAAMNKNASSNIKLLYILTFNPLQKKGRVYKIGAKLIEIPKKAVDKIIEWNTGFKRDDVRYDKKICHSLLLCLVAKAQLQKAVVEPDVIRFIKGKICTIFFWNLSKKLSMIHFFFK